MQDIDAEILASRIHGVENQCYRQYLSRWKNIQKRIIFTIARVAGCLGNKEINAFFFGRRKEGSIHNKAMQKGTIETGPRSCMHVAVIDTQPRIGNFDRLVKRSLEDQGDKTVEWQIVTDVNRERVFKNLKAKAWATGPHFDETRDFHTIVFWLGRRGIYGHGDIEDGDPTTSAGQFRNATFIGTEMPKIPASYIHLLGNGLLLNI